jgi:hypothetical protein
LSQAIVEGQQINPGRFDRWLDVVHVDAPTSASRLGAAPAAGVVDEDPPHHLGGGREELLTAVPAPDRLGINQPEESLLDQGRGLESLAGLLPRQPAGGELAQLVVDQGEQVLGGAGVAPLDVREDAGHVRHRHARRRPPRPRHHPYPGPVAR